MVDLNGHEAGNGGHSQGKPTAYRDSSTRREAIYRQSPFPLCKASCQVTFVIWHLFTLRCLSTVCAYMCRDSHLSRLLSSSQH